MKNMKACERIAEAMLRHMAYEPVYEPRGRDTTPDFEVADCIAVEVRRLNQNYTHGDGKKGLEETERPLINRIHKIAIGFGSGNGESWFIHLRFSREVPRWQDIKADVKDAFERFVNSSNRTDCRVFSHDRLNIDLKKASRSYESLFLMGMTVDENSGGFIVGEMADNIEYCSSVKLDKIGAIKNEYREWWLVLVDYISFGLDDYDKQELLATVAMPYGWDRIIVVSPNNPAHFFELPK
jgi:hypothetical protein